MFYITGIVVWCFLGLLLSFIAALYFWSAIKALKFTFRVCKHLDRKWYKEPVRDFLKFWWGCTIQPPDALHFRTKGSIYFNEKGHPEEDRG